MSNQLNGSNNLLFISFTISMIVTTVVLLLNLFQGYSPFSAAKFLMPSNPSPYLEMKYINAEERIFLLLTISLIICECTAVIGFILTLIQFKMSVCLKTSYCIWLVYNKLNLLYLLVAISTISIIVVSSWQTIILVEILIPTHSASIISTTSLVLSYLTLLLLLIELILLIRERKITIQMEVDLEMIIKMGQITIQNQMRRLQKNQEKEIRRQSLKTTKKNIKSTKNKQNIIHQQNKKLTQMKQGFLQGIKQGQIYEIDPQQNKQKKKSLSQSDFHQIQQIKSSKASSKRKVIIPKLPINQAKSKHNMQRAKNASLSLLDISIIKPSRPENKQPFKDNQADCASILCKIREGRIPQENARSPRPDIPKLNQMFKNQNSTPTPKYFTSSKLK